MQEWAEEAVGLAKERVTDIVERLSLPIVQSAGLDLIGVEYKKEGDNWFLRVYIDKAGGVDIDDCSQVSERLSERLDEIDPIPSSYFLEVSSPGAERPLKQPVDFQRAVGKGIHVSLYEPLAGLKVVEGTLLRYDGETADLEWNEKGQMHHLQVPLKAIASARLSVRM